MSKLLLTSPPVLFPRGYFRKVRSMRRASLLAYWPLWEAAGTAVQDHSGADRDALANANVTFAQPGIGDGKTSVQFNGTEGAGGSAIRLYSSSLSSAFNGDEITVAWWFKPPNAAYWTDAAFHDYPVIYGTAANNYIYARKDSTNGRISFVRNATVGLIQLQWLSQSWTNWTHMAWTFSKSNSRFRAYKDGVLTGTPITNSDAWDHTGGLRSDQCCLGTGSYAAPIHVGLGYFAHLAIWSAELTTAELVSLARIR